MIEFQDKRFPLPQRWGRVWRSTFWVASLAIAPVAAGAVPIFSAMLAGGACALLLLITYNPEAAGLWGEQPASLFTALFFLFTPAVAAAVLINWVLRSPMSARATERGLVVWSIAGRTTIKWKDVVRAFVTLPPRDSEASSKRTLHLWTPRREVAIPVSRLLAKGTFEQRYAAFDSLIDTTEACLSQVGMPLSRGVPSSYVTDTTKATRFVLMWPHRRLLARDFARLNRPDRPVDHTAPRPSIALAWMFRPAPVAALVVGLGSCLAVRWGTDAAWAAPLLAGAGLLAALLLPAWNEVKRRFLAFRSGSALTPELLIGEHTVSRVPSALVPAPGCFVDLEAQTLKRPDGRVFDFASITGVEYGPPRTAERSAHPLQGAWHLAVFTDEARRLPQEIYSNASADIVKHGDLDAGYAVFNWITARSIAAAAQCQLVLANGRVPATQVTRPLTERVAAELAHYDPDQVRAEMDAKGLRSTVHIKVTDDRFEAWGPLSRLPEHCATPPIWKLTVALFALGSIATGFVAGGLIAGYLLALCAHDLLTANHFRAPGFSMDAKGVWVRGTVIPWDDLEESTLMPVAPGPILFAGARSVTIAGHLGVSYHDRVLLGSAAYAWMLRHRPTG